MININPFGKRTLGDILGTFKKALQELDAFMAEALVKHEANVAQVVRLTEENRVINAEIAKAQAVKTNIEKLIEE